MKKILAVCFAAVFLLCSCNFGSNTGANPTDTENDSLIVGKWIDVETEQIIEYTASGFYYEYINEGFTADKTRYVTENGKIYYYLDGDSPDKSFGVDYEIKDGHLFVAGVLEYKPMDLKTSVGEME